MDKKSAKQILRRQGIGRITHFSLKLFWIQTHVLDGLIHFRGIDSAKNIADGFMYELRSELVKTLQLEFFS